jgi:hypothetical protein
VKKFLRAAYIVFSDYILMMRLSSRVSDERCRLLLCENDSLRIEVERLFLDNLRLRRRGFWRRLFNL